MFTKEEVWNSFANDFRIIKHLAEKVHVDTHGYKPTEKQRTMLELMQYMSIMGSGILNTVLMGDGNTFASYVEQSKSVMGENFIQKMNEQETEMKETFMKFDDAELAKELSLWGMTGPKSMFVLNLIKIVASYKMQLFLYVKASGQHGIGTSNLWAGMDMPTSAK